MTHVRSSRHDEEDGGVLGRGHLSLCPSDVLLSHHCGDDSAEMMHFLICSFRSGGGDERRALVLRLPSPAQTLDHAATSSLTSLQVDGVCKASIHPGRFWADPQYKSVTSHLS